MMMSRQVVGEQRDGRKKVKLLIVGGGSIGRREVLVIVQKVTVVTVVVRRRHEMRVGKMIRHGHGRTEQDGGLEFGMTLEDRIVSPPYKI